MILNLTDKIRDVIKDAMDFVDKNFDEPFLWIGIFLVLLLLSVAFINSFGDK